MGVDEIAHGADLLHQTPLESIGGRRRRVRYLLLRNRQLCVRRRWRRRIKFLRAGIKQDVQRIEQGFIVGHRDENIFRFIFIGMEGKKPAAVRREAIGAANGISVGFSTQFRRVTVLTERENIESDLLAFQKQQIAHVSDLAAGGLIRRHRDDETLINGVADWQVGGLGENLDDFLFLSREVASFRAHINRISFRAENILTVRRRAILHQHFQAERRTVKGLPCAIDARRG